MLLTAVLAVAASQGRLGENLYWGTWTQLQFFHLHPMALVLVLAGDPDVSG